MSDSLVRSIANELWGKIDGTATKVNHYGKGMVISGMDMQQAFDLINLVPDLKITRSDSVLFIHRAVPGGAIYFISNQKNRTVNITAAFRIAGKRPEWWNAVMGSVRDLPSFSQTLTTTSVPLTLAPFESAFIIFSNEAIKGDTSKSNFPKPQRTIEVTKPWVVQFDHKMRGPDKPVVFSTLTDWSLHPNDSIKYYSGTAFYHTTFDAGPVLKGEKYVLDLGMVKAIAKVTVNGMEVGGVWTPPYQVDITRAIKPGVNSLEVKVVNTWVNRLIGDSMLPAGERKTFAYVHPDPGNGLESSGLLGPVEIEMIK